MIKQEGTIIDKYISLRKKAINLFVVENSTNQIKAQDKKLNKNTIA